MNLSSLSAVKVTSWMDSLIRPFPVTFSPKNSLFFFIPFSLSLSPSGTPVKHMLAHFILTHKSHLLLSFCLFVLSSVIIG